MMYLIAVLVTLFAIVCWLATVVGLPGTWVMVVIGVLLAWLPPEEWIGDVSWGNVAALVGLALFGELIEFVASAAGVGKLGGSRRAATYAIIGSMVGALSGMFIGLPIPIPVIGSLIGSVLFGALGAAVGAYFGERTIGKNIDGSMKIGLAAFVGRIFGTVGKALCAAVMAVFLIALCWWR